VTNTTPTTRTIPIRPDLDRLVRLLAQSLYASPDAFVRELIQNGSDAIVRRQERDPSHAGRIEIEVRPTRLELVVRDDGIGMTRREIERFLSVIGGSGTSAARDRLETAGAAGDEARADALIGTHGVGALSCLGVAEHFSVHTRRWRAPNGGWLWEWDGSSHGRLRRGDARHAGTEVTLFLAPGQEELVTAPYLAQAIRCYADLVPHPIVLIDGEARGPSATPVNRMRAPWDDPGWGRPEARRALAERFLEADASDPLLTIPVHLDGPVRARGVLYAGAPEGTSAPRGVDIHVRRMCVRRGERELLPSWADFLRGLVDSPDLRPNASREAVTQDAAFGVLRRQLGTVVAEGLTEVATARPEAITRLADRFPSALKALALRDETFLAAAAPLLPFDSSAGRVRLARALGGCPLERAAGRELWYRPAGGSAPGPARPGEPVVIEAGERLDVALLEAVARLFSLVLRRAEPRARSGGEESGLPAAERELWRAFEAEVAAVLAQSGIRDVPVRVVAQGRSDPPADVRAGRGVIERRRLRRELAPGADDGLLPRLAAATRRAVEESNRELAVLLNASHPAVRDLSGVTGDGGTLRDAAILTLVMTPLVCAVTAGGDPQLPLLRAPLEQLLAHAARTLSQQPTLPGVAPRA
jgi:molecular chaperone HtpG